MKLFLVFFVGISLCAGSAIPTVPGDNSHYVEGESRYIWMPDGDGVPHLVDLEAPADATAFNSKGGIDNEYWLFTRQNPTIKQIIIDGNLESLRNSNYDPNKPLMVIAHGWNSKGTSSLNPRITFEYLRIADANVIVLDWSSVASGLYTTSVIGVPDVGQFLGLFLVWLINIGGGNWDNVHLVGFSLGAHVVGNAGRATGSRVGRVTGLDPAGPQWGSNPFALNPFDGQHVEAIHTDGGLLGIFYPVGYADFYPNGGRNPQPGCLISTCSHSRAHELFAASVRYNRFVGRQCVDLTEARNNRCSGSRLIMGNSINFKGGNSGLFALGTTNRWPFHLF